MTATSVEELGSMLQRFGVVDYIVFTLMLLICAVIGIYYGFISKQVTADDYLMGGRKMTIFPVSMSLIASAVSGITLIGTSTELYLYGTQYLYICFGVVLMGFAMTYAYLPVLHDLQLTSIYEYWELRFNKQARLFGSVLFVIFAITWTPIVIYVPALAFNQVTGVNVHVVSPLVCVICIFYTCVGGLKAVVWTDVIQTIIMFGAMVLVAVKGTMDIGGTAVVWQRNLDSGRIELPNLSIDPLERHTLIIMVIGGCVSWIYKGGIMQIMAQRYVSLPKLRDARIAVWIFVLGVLSLTAVCGYNGLLIYATYYDCDPLTTKLAKAKDQLLPLLVMRTLADFPGLPGCFVAGVFSAALSSMSTTMNSMAVVVLEDFYKPFSAKPLTERQTSILMRTVVVIFGFVCVALVFFVEKLGSVLQATMSLDAITSGPSLGIFSIGFFLPWVTCKGMVAGGVVALGFMSWIILGAQTAIATGRIVHQTKPMTVEGCTYEFSSSNTTLEPTTDDVFVLFRISYLWYTVLGAVVTMVVSLVVSFATGPNDPRDVEHRLLSPVIRWMMPQQNTKCALSKGYEGKIRENHHTSSGKKEACEKVISDEITEQDTTPAVAGGYECQK
ncbi:sodium-coupled monocarboxylate transporter 1-like [Anabrus simplex]|uniref:sodium-coupled monocarboxylate transporter 1-like n=1 Tax=Anabrus simplex TaxID=316456 RepID=UPI0035A38274